LLDGQRTVLREAMVVYSVSPSLPDAAAVLADGLRARAIAWKKHAVDRA